MAGVEGQAGLNIALALTRPIALQVDFQIHGFTALLGRSGAGKTSLLKALAGLLPATGTPWAGLAPQHRRVGYLPQNAALFPHLTVLQNAAFALTGATRLARAQQWLDRLGVGDLAARNAASLSGGQAQRVALARALACAPALLLLDEPTAGLDPTTSDATLACIAEVIAATQTPALAATHDPAVAAQADWLALLADGRIIRQGPAHEVFNDPQTTSAAALLGYHNIWQAGAASYAIRAEDIELSPTGIQATITAWRRHARHMRIYCTAPQPLIIDTAPQNLTVGETVFLRFAEGKLKEVLLF